MSGPSQVEPPPGPRVVAPPAVMDGYFATAKSHLDWAPGSTTIIIPNWSDPIADAARSLEERGAFALVSAHHCFGNPRSKWEQCWAQTKAWMKPVEDTGRLLGIFVIDEPLGGEIQGLTYADIDAALARVKADGYRTMTCETYNRYRVNYVPDGYMPNADWFGLTAYYIARPYWVTDAMRADPRINVVFAPSGGGYSPWGPEDFEDVARDTNARGIFRWSLDLGAASR